MGIKDQKGKQKLIIISKQIIVLPRSCSMSGSSDSFSNLSIKLRIVLNAYKTGINTKILLCRHVYKEILQFKCLFSKKEFILHSL